MIARRLLAVATAGLLLAACADDIDPGTVGLYDRAPVPAVPDRTEPIDPGGATLADGLYWAELVGFDAGQQPVLLFRLTQAFFAATCLAELGEDGCTDDYGTLDDPSRTVDVPLPQVVSVTVAAPSRQNYAVTAAELLALAGAGTAAAAAPPDYQYIEFPYLLTVRDGLVVEAHQIWVP
ncbi:MAG: hypothetical protein Q7V88_15515 [Actinomycetota bacterium]|nr:hypothetical protein [Actinomycetota bacterium]